MIMTFGLSIGRYFEGYHVTAAVGLPGRVFRVHMRIDGERNTQFDVVRLSFFGNLPHSKEVSILTRVPHVAFVFAIEKATETVVRTPNVLCIRHA